MAGANKTYLSKTLKDKLPQLISDSGINLDAKNKHNDKALKSLFEANNKMIADEVGALFDGIRDDLRTNYVRTEEYSKLATQYENDKVKWAKEKDDLLNQVDNIGQYSRRDNIKIVNVEYNDGEDVEKIVLDVAKDAGVNLTKEDISIAHRINTKDDETSNSERNSRSQPKKIPSIIARIVNRKKRNQLFEARKEIQKNSNATHKEAKIYDDVTPLRSRILYALRNKKRCIR